MKYSEFLLRRALGDIQGYLHQHGKHIKKKWFNNSNIEEKGQL